MIATLSLQNQAIAEFSASESKEWRGICSHAIKSGVTSPIKSPRLSLTLYDSLAVCQSRHF